MSTKLAVASLLLAIAGCAAPGERATGETLDASVLRGLGERGRGAGSHVLLISVDTLRADRLGCYGSRSARTPTIDALAAHGVRFDQATCGAPITLPSHTTLLTGLDPPSHGVRLNGTFRLEGEHTTLAEVLQSSGYTTAAVVGAFVLDARYGLGQGFDVYDDNVLPQAGGAGGRRFPARTADRVTDAATAWLERHLAGPGSDPFFLWVHYYDPHFPYDPPAPHRESFPEPYDGEIAFTDAQIGRLVDFLVERGVWDKTLVVFAGDHGEGLGEHDEATHIDLIYDSTMRVPLIFSSRRLFGDGGAVRDRIVGLVAVFPTLLDLLGIDHDPQALDGRNVMTAPADPGRAVYIESLAGYLEYGWAALHGLRRVGDKLILGPDPEYFDLVQDPDELNSLYDSAAEAAELQRQLERRLEREPASNARARAQELDEEELDRLAALGYVRGSAPAGGAGADPKAMMHISARIEEAVGLVAEGDPQGALRKIEEVLAEQPDAGRALYMATAIYDQLGRPEEGERTLRRALAVQPKSEGWVHLAWYAFHRRDFAVFETALAEAERLDPMDGGIYISRAHRAALEGRLDKALSLFEKALQVDPVRSGPDARENIRAIKDALRGKRSGH
jgi:arylsulfatase A-like enzyme